MSITDVPHVLSAPPTISSDDLPSKLRDLATEATGKGWTAEVRRTPQRWTLHLRALTGALFAPLVVELEAVWGGQRPSYVPALAVARMSGRADRQGASFAQVRTSMRMVQVTYPAAAGDRLVDGLAHEQWAALANYTYAERAANVARGIQDVMDGLARNPDPWAEAAEEQIRVLLASAWKRAERGWHTARRAYFERHATVEGYRPDVAYARSCARRAQVLAALAVPLAQQAEGIVREHERAFLVDAVRVAAQRELVIQRGPRKERPAAGVFARAERTLSLLATIGAEFRDWRSRHSATGESRSDAWARFVGAQEVGEQALADVRTLAGDARLLAVFRLAEQAAVARLWNRAKPYAEVQEHAQRGLAALRRGHRPSALTTEASVLLALSDVPAAGPAAALWADSPHTADSARDLHRAMAACAGLWGHHGPALPSAAS